jgi:protein TonB
VVVPDDPQTMVKAKEEKVSQAERSTEEKKEEGDDGGEEGGQPGGVPGGVSGGVPGGQLGGQLGGKVGGQGTRAVLPFGAGMTRPQRISGRDPVYSKEALAARVEGLMIVRCTITVEGRLDRCRVIKTLPFMERAVLDALATHRYTPVMFQGQPVSVQYVFNIKLVMP